MTTIMASVVIPHVVSNYRFGDPFSYKLSLNNFYFYPLKVSCAHKTVLTFTLSLYPIRVGGS